MQQLIQLVINAVAIGSIYAVVALGFEIAYESTGVVNVATGQLVTVGTLLGALLGASAVLFCGTHLPAWPFLSAYGLVFAGMAVVGGLFFVGVFLPQRRPARMRPTPRRLMRRAGRELLARDARSPFTAPPPRAPAAPSARTHRPPPARPRTTAPGPAAGSADPAAAHPRRGPRCPQC